LGDTRSSLKRSFDNTAFIVGGGVGGARVAVGLEMFLGQQTWRKMDGGLGKCKCI